MKFGAKNKAKTSAKQNKKAKEIEEINIEPVPENERTNDGAEVKAEPVSENESETEVLLEEEAEKWLKDKEST